jgi:transcriptional regulator with XRE-family HTH domain
MQDPKPNYQLRAAREEKLWTLEEAAEQVGVNVQTFWRWEMMGQRPRPDAMRSLRAVFGRLPEELGFGRSSANAGRIQWAEETVSDEGLAPTSTPTRQKSSFIQLTPGQGAFLLSLLKESTMAHFDPKKRKTLQQILDVLGIALAGSQLGDPERWEQLALTQQKPLEAIGHHLDLDIIDDYTESLRALLARGEAQYAMRASEKLYNKLMHEHPYSSDLRLAETQLRLGMLVGAAQEYALPWYQRDQAVIQTYNHIENTIIQKFGVNSSLRCEYVRLLAKRGRQHRVLWQFDECIKECEDGIIYMRTIDDSPLYTHFLCERAHIEATRGDELLWLRKLEEARRGTLDMNMMSREKALNQVDYMQGEGYKRFAFQTQKDLPITVREKYARLALSQFSQWNGATIELPGFEALVVQVSKTQCLILIDPEEALRLAGRVQKQAEQRYPTLLDKVHRVIFLAQQRLQMSGSDFLQMFKEVSSSAYHLGKNIL